MTINWKYKLTLIILSLQIASANAQCIGNITLEKFSKPMQVRQSDKKEIEADFKVHRDSFSCWEKADPLPDSDNVKKSWILFYPNLEKRLKVGGTYRVSYGKENDFEYWEMRSVYNKKNNNNQKDTKEFRGKLFEISYPSDLIARPNKPFKKSYNGVDTNTAYFSSANKDIEFLIYIFTSFADGPSFPPETELMQGEKRVDMNQKKTSNKGAYLDRVVSKWVTYQAKDGSYLRSVALTKACHGLTDNCRWTVFGLKYKDQATYKKYLNDYLGFKQSLIDFY